MQFIDRHYYLDLFNAIYTADKIIAAHMLHVILRCDVN